MYGWEDCPGNHEDIIRSAMETRLCDAFLEVNSEVENKMLDDARGLYSVLRRSERRNYAPWSI